MNLEVIIIAIIAYLVGSIPTGIVIAKLMGAPDPRSTGRGHIRAPNAGMTGGEGAGIITLIGDILKGFLITSLAFYIFGNSPTAVSITGLAVFLGHIYPIFLLFKGGKGVATALGVFLAIGALQALIAVILFAVIVAIFRYVSLGSMIAAVSIPILFSLFEATIPYVPLAVIIAVLIVFKHSDNIKRLVNRTENKVGGKKTQN